MGAWGAGSAVLSLRLTTRFSVTFILIIVFPLLVQPVEADHVEFKVAGLAYRYGDASLDGLRSLSSRLCKCCHVLCAV